SVCPLTLGVTIRVPLYIRYPHHIATLHQVFLSECPLTLKVPLSIIFPHQSAPLNHIPHQRAPSHHMCPSECPFTSYVPIRVPLYIRYPSHIATLYQVFLSECPLTL
ncbi:unnamed protein product, partial [Staurois parvus]